MIRELDVELLTACARGDREALGALFDRYHRPVARFLTRLCDGSTRDLDDLVQGTFIEAARSAKNFRNEASVRTWIFGIAANVARHHFRALARRRSVLVELALRPEVSREAPDRVIEQRELVAIVVDELPSLPDHLRTAFVMCDLEESRGVEAARVLGIREGTLWRRLHDARKALRSVLEEATA